MNSFLSLSMFFVPVAVVAVFWAELFLRNDWSGPMYLVIATVAACVCWTIKDTGFAQTLRPIMMGCFIGCFIAFFVVGPILAEQGFNDELEEMKKHNPAAYRFFTQSTAQISVHQHQRDRGLKIAIPIWFMIGGFVGGTISSLSRKRKLTKNKASVGA